MDRKRMRHPFIALLGFIGALFLVMMSAASATASPAISSDQPEYTLGDTAAIYGVGFAPNVSVILEVIRSDGSIVTGDGTNTPGSDTVVTDAMGAFTYSYIIEGPPEAYAANVIVNARDAASPVTILATTTFIDGTQYILQGCSKDRGDCSYDASSGWAGGSSPMRGWSASTLKGWFDDDDIPFRLRIGLRDAGSHGVYHYLTEQDNYHVASGILGIEYGTGFYVGAGPSVPGYAEGQLTKNCVLQAPSMELPTAAKPCIVNGPFYPGVDDDGQGGIDEDPVDGIDNDADGRIDEDPPQYNGGSSVRRLQYVWSIYFSSSEAGTRDDKWALYWKGHASSAAHAFPGGSLHNHTNSNGDQEVDTDRCGEHSGSGTDLQITKTDAPDPVLVGQNLTYTLTVHNNGPSSASGVTVSDTLPMTVTYGSATSTQGTCSMSSGTVTCNVGSMNNGATVTITIVVTPLSAGTLSNTAIVSSATSDPTPSNNTAGPVTTTVNPSANLSIIKSDAPDPVLAGQNLTYTITVANAGPSSATGVTMTDTLPANMTFVSVTPGSPTCTQSSGTVTCGLGTMANGANTTITIVVTPTAAAVGTRTNTASVTSSVSDPNTSNNSSSATTTINAAANLSITKTDAPDPVLAGSNLTYTLTVANAGPSSATTVTVTDTLPAGVTFVSSTPSQGSCSGTSTVTCALGTLANAASATVTIVVTPTASGTLSNTASVTSAVTDPNTGDNSSTVTTTVSPAANLSITKTDAPDPVLVGSNLTYTIVVSNAGPSSATSVTMTDPLPAGVTFVSVTPGSPTCTQASGTVTCGLGTMASGASTTITIVVTPTASGTLSNTASVSSPTSDPNTGNNSATATTTVSGLSADLSINKADSPDPVLVGQNLTYTITVTNAGPNSATGVTVTDTLPAGATWVSSTPSQGSCSGTSTVTCTLGILGSGASAIVTIVVTPTAGGTLSNTASVSSGVSDPSSANNSSTTSTTVNVQADLSITKTDAPDPVAVGNPLTYSITVTNNGPNTATGVTMTDPLPAGATWVSSTPSQGSCSGTSTVTCAIGTLGNGASATITIVVTPTAAGTLTNTASVSSSVTDPNSANNSSTGTTTVTASADLSITKTDSPDPVVVGGTLTYTITVTNNGPNSASGVTVTDTRPAATTFVSATPSQGSCSGTSTITCALGTLAYPGSATVTIVVTPTAAGTLSNTASVSSTTTDPVPGNNTTPAVTTTVNPATVLTDLAVTQVAAPSPAEIGAQVTYTITVTNNGPGTATGVTLNNTLPTNATFDSVGTTQGTCGAPSGGTFTCNLGTIANGGSVTITLVVTTTMLGSVSNTASVSGNESESTTVNNSASAAANVGDVSRLINISTRGPVLTAPNTMFGGFVLGGNVSKTLLIRGRGPSLSGAPFNIAGTLANPMIQLYSGATIIAQNDNWQTTDPLCLSPATACGNAAQITATLLDPCRPNPGQTVAPPGCANEAALLVTLPPGPYTVILSGVGGGTGIGLFGVTDLDTGTAPKLVNISTRSVVQAAPNLMHGGFIIGAGTGSKTVVIRGRGPSLGGAPFNIAGTLSNPKIDVYSGTTIIARSDNWQTTDPLCLSPAVACGNAAQITATGLDPCVPNPGQTVAPPGCANEAAVLITLPPGPYTVVMSGVGAATGVALIGITEVSADLAITKVASPNPVTVGNPLTYTLTVTNNSTYPATGTTVLDPLPAGVTPVSATSTQGTCTLGGTVTCNLGTVATGSPVTVTIVVTPTVAGTISNTASVTGSLTDPNESNNMTPAVITTVNP